MRAQKGVPTTCAGTLISDLGLQHCENELSFTSCRSCGYSSPDGHTAEPSRNRPPSLPGPLASPRGGYHASPERGLHRAIGSPKEELTGPHNQLPREAVKREMFLVTEEESEARKSRSAR